MLLEGVDRYNHPLNNKRRLRNRGLNLTCLWTTEQVTSTQSNRGFEIRQTRQLRDHTKRPTGRTTDDTVTREYSGRDRDLIGVEVRSSTSERSQYTSSNKYRRVCIYGVVPPTRTDSYVLRSGPM